MEVKHLLRFGMNFEIHNGKLAEFCSDRWYGNQVLGETFPRLFAISDTVTTVVEMWVEGQWAPHFKRMFGEQEAQEWQGLLEALSGVHISEGVDIIL